MARELSLKIELIQRIGWLVKLRWIAIAGVFSHRQRRKLGVQHY